MGKKKAKKGKKGKKAAYALAGLCLGALVAADAGATVVCEGSEGNFRCVEIEAPAPDFCFLSFIDVRSNTDTESSTGLAGRQCKLLQAGVPGSEGYVKGSCQIALSVFNDPPVQSGRHGSTAYWYQVGPCAGRLLPP